MPAALDKPGAMARRLRKLLDELARIDAELPTLLAEELANRERQRRADDTRRKLLIGMAVLDWVFQHPRLIPFLRRALAAGLTRTRDRQFFNLDDDGPLIPAEDWAGWPDARAADETLVETPRAGMSPRQRQVRIAYLRKRAAAIAAELTDLGTRYAPRRDANNKQRQILVGAVMLLTAWSERTTRRLRKLLNLRYTEARDRKLFLLEGDGPLVPQEEPAGRRPTRRQAAKPRSANARSSPAAGAVRRPRSASGRANDSGDAKGSEPKDPDHTRRADDVGDADPAPNAEAPAPDTQEPIPGWTPYKLRVKDAIAASRRSDWGAQLRGHAAVQALPMELVGRLIRVTDSNHYSWDTRVTEVVSRDDVSIIVRNSGRPRAARRAIR
ncbi:MAG: hypothetical protein OXG35_18265 [Acidobacteria bacterium]|nr:hypothetical protein [Acidobacteriota bacterium]